MPKNNSHEHDISLDYSKNNTKWQGAIAADLDQKMEDETYEDLCHKCRAKSPTDFKKIRIHFICNVKHVDFIKRES